MKARPILFSSPMVRSLLDGRKTQTRRVIKPQPNDINHRTSEEVNIAWQEGFIPVQCPFGKKGDVLWVRETFSTGYEYNHDFSIHTWYWADGNPTNGYWSKPRPSIYLPRRASRLTLEITRVRVEQLQDISEADCIAEGVIFGRQPFADTPWIPDAAKEAYRLLWESINGPESWDKNPWVWVIEFKVHPINVDDFIRGKTA